ncbi:hypothetical protein GCM10010191_52210 [Actinomadura vinacea]|uniref:Uncharacterized protein n=1 Tax=Actinomadura vinacea TaxID=115336 RepID=A0ABN3JLU2_9ACTN
MVSIQASVRDEGPLEALGVLDGPLMDALIITGLLTDSMFRDGVRTRARWSLHPGSNGDEQA